MYTKKSNNEFWQVIGFSLLLLILLAGLIYWTVPRKTHLTINLPVPHSYPADYFQYHLKLTKESIVQLYDVDEEKALEYSYLINCLATAHNKFPTRGDLIAIIAVESRFNPQALSHKGAKGLMQIMGGDYFVYPNLTQGTDLLNEYYKELKGDKSATLQAYNVGITAYKNGKRNPRYLHKFNNESNKLAGVN